MRQVEVETLGQGGKTKIIEKKQMAEGVWDNYKREFGKKLYILTSADRKRKTPLPDFDLQAL